MSGQTITKNVTVISVVPAIELATGEGLQQVAFGENIEVTNEILSRIPPQSLVGKKLGVSDLILFVKMEESPYAVGSKWRLTVETDGKITLVKLE